MSAMTRRRTRMAAMAPIAALGILPACSAAPSPTAAAAGIHAIRHVVVIFQENRSFDSYFGTYPGATGIPMSGGTPSVCVPDPATGSCVRPFVDHADRNGGGPHNAVNSTADVNGGKMDGFIAQSEAAKHGCANPTNPGCAELSVPDVMAYHVQSDIPNYWSYAQNYVLQDRMFESVHSWSFPSHLYLVSGWAATCPHATDPMSCTLSVDPPNRSASKPTPFAWTDLTYLLHSHGISWAWYLDQGASQGGAYNGGAKGGVPKIWNVLPGFGDLQTDGQTGNIQPQTSFFSAAKAGTLPAVSWLLPDPADSEHPPGLVSQGQGYVTNIINAVMRSPDWDSTAIFVTWDDWGGFYDQVVPPTADVLGYGIRVPGLVISPYARRGYVDHQTLSFDAYLKFIEDDFLGGARLNPTTDGRPDPRPDVRESSPLLGNLVGDFDFSQLPRPPTPLPPCPQTTLTGVPSGCPYGSGG